MIKFIAFNAVNFMAAFCIIKTIRSDPGRVPLVWDFSKAQSKKYCLLCHNFKVRSSPQISPIDPITARLVGDAS
jgi:hypothetical protein